MNLDKDNGFRPWPGYLELDISNIPPLNSKWKLEDNLNLEEKWNNAGTN